MPKFVINQEYIPVSAYFIENFLKDANGVFLKVYLYALNLAVKGIEVDTTTIAKELNLLESDVIQALDYWKSTNMVIEDSGVIEFCDKPISIFEPQYEVCAVPEASSQIEQKHYNNIDLANVVSSNQSLSELFMLAQELLAKPLTQSDLDTIYWFYDELGFSTEAILVLLDYCISIDKRNLRYIETVAIAWHEKGITTAEQMMQYINEEKEKRDYLYQLKKAIGINDRPLSQTETDFITKWHDEYKIPDDMILLAYELCLINTSKLSLPYMDKIIGRWHTEGITTKDAALEDNKSFKNRTNEKFNAYGDQFDHNGLENLTRKY